MLQESIYNSFRIPHNVACRVLADETDLSYRFVSLY